MSLQALGRTDGSPLVKLCGLRRAEDVEAAVVAGADFGGLVFAESKRRVTVEAARALVRLGSGRIKFVGVFSGHDVATIDRIAARTSIDMAQITDLPMVGSIEMLKTPYIATVHVGDAMSEEEILHIVRSYRSAVALLVDSWSPLGGGSGVAPDWRTAGAFVRAASLPVFLAGGLRAENVAEALTYVHPAGVDVSSGIEVDGWKDATLMSRFVEIVRSHRNGAAACRHIVSSSIGDSQW